MSLEAPAFGPADPQRELQPVLGPGHGAGKENMGICIFYYKNNV